MEFRKELLFTRSPGGLAFSFKSLFMVLSVYKISVSDEWTVLYSGLAIEESLRESQKAMALP